jgi:hypothetical protein
MKHENLGVTGPMNGDIAKNIPLVAYSADFAT